MIAEKRELSCTQEGVSSTPLHQKKRSTQVGAHFRGGHVREPKGLPELPFLSAGDMEDVPPTGSIPPSGIVFNHHKPNKTPNLTPQIVRRTTALCLGSRV